ncbi:MAG: hypothetical protein U9P50_01625 [Patescibacteria group bacterium]|nr:hypothetical protein [Patescibacteria group bacterium]
MGIILNFSKKKEERDRGDLNDLNGLLKRANQLIKTSSALSSEQPIVRVKSRDHFIRKLEAVISTKIMKKKMISRGMFLCGIYAPKVVVQYLSTSPKSWTAIDYLQENNRAKHNLNLKLGGDVCFLICCLFPERGDWRLMNLTYYKKMGMSFYYRFFQGTDKEIGYHMSDNFDEIVSLTSQSVHSL